VNTLTGQAIIEKFVRLAFVPLFTGLLLNGFHLTLVSLAFAFYSKPT